MMTPPMLFHLAIAASAGTGKTYRLAHRYMALMAAGVPPERICALTFTRKAAGEIFDQIVQRLCACIDDPSQRKDSLRLIQQEGVVIPDSPEPYRAMLRRMLHMPHRVHIGTLDSFLLGVVRAFAVELGLPPDLTPTEEERSEAQALRSQTLLRIFDPSPTPGGHPPSWASLFPRYFRWAHMGEERKSPLQDVERFLRDYAELPGKTMPLPSDLPPAALWKGLARMARKSATGLAWWASAEVRSTPIPTDLPEQLRSHYQHANQRLADQLAKMAKAAMRFHAAQPWPDELTGTVFQHLMSQAAGAAPPTIPYNRKQYLVPQENPCLWPPLRAVLAKVVRAEVARIAIRSCGYRHLLRIYHQVHQLLQDTLGLYAFEDLAFLLGRDGGGLTRDPSASDRLYIDYRLDAQLDHWLLDEFQDTSTPQWEAIANLVDEIIQDPARSFFYVGDIKQTLYAWRGSNPRLFAEVFQKYTKGSTSRMRRETLSTSYRSSPAVLEAVNGMFEGLSDWITAVSGAPHASPIVHPNAVAMFTQAWSRHQSATLNPPGYAALLQYSPKLSHQFSPDSDADAGENSAETREAPQFQIVAKVLDQVRPLDRGLTVAVLVRTNEEGRACVEALRRRFPSIPVVHEGRGGIVDHPVVALLLALVRYAAHPGDTVARRHLQMSPLVDALAPPAGSQLPQQLLSEFHENGFAATLRRWAAKIPSLDEAGRRRLEDMIRAAELFDATGSRDPDAFGDFVRAYQVKADAAQGCVRVMTIHQSKGLGFDMVLVPFSASPRAPTFLRPMAFRFIMHPTVGLLELPRGELTEAVSGLKEAVDSARAEANFSQLCVLYVAMTRAAKALYLIIPERMSSREACRETDWLRHRFPGTPPTEQTACGLPIVRAIGDPRWFETYPPMVSPSVPSGPPRPTFRWLPILRRREPSKEHDANAVIRASWLFDRESGDIRAFGSAIHRLFQRIHWIEETDIEALVQVWRRESPESEQILTDAEAQFRYCLNQPEVRHLLSKPPAPVRAEVWREVPFEVRVELNGEPQIIGGRFDRLVLEGEPSGKPQGVTIVDFKSNLVDTEQKMLEVAAGYVGQMRDYALAASCLFDVPLERITSLLLFTRLGRVLDMKAVRDSERDRK